jgi:hypothetical protein
MLSECANPDCRKEFDCHQGRFFRFHAVHDENGQPRNTHGVVHFWLCGRCSQTYSLDYVEDCGVTVRHRFEKLHCDSGYIQANPEGRQR